MVTVHKHLGIYPQSPTPSPWTWREGSASGQGALFGPRWLPESLRALKMASKIAQDSPTWLQLAHNMRPRGSSTAPRRLQVVKEPPKEALERPKSFNYATEEPHILDFMSCVHYSTTITAITTSPEEVNEAAATQNRSRNISGAHCPPGTSVS